MLNSLSARLAVALVVVTLAAMDSLQEGMFFITYVVACIVVTTFAFGYNRLARMGLLRPTAIAGASVMLVSFAFESALPPSPNAFLCVIACMFMVVIVQDRSGATMGQGPQH